MIAHRFAVDAGGSRTRVVAVPADGEPTSFELDSINPARGPAAEEALGELFARLRTVLGPGRALGWLASASTDPTSAGRERKRIRGLTGGLDAKLLISNDLVPLLWGVPDLADTGVAVVCGTGSGFLGANAGMLARAGGCEYLASDEGSAVDLGLGGLRAAVRALDGRGEPTQLTSAFADWSGLPAPELARRLAAEPYPKQRLGELAPVTCATWLAGDRVAGEVVRAALAELTLGVRAVRDRLALPAGFSVALTGGVLSGCRELCSEFAARLRADLEAAQACLVTDTAGTVLAALTRLLGPDGGQRLPSCLADQHVWLVLP